jgi:cation diffusion facilitator family transporter
MTSIPPSLEEARARKGRVTRITLVITFGLNLLVASGKLAVGVATGSLSMVADGFHSLLDGASNVVGFIGIVAASRPPDSNHPYGHGKFETLASMGIGLMLFLAAYTVLSEMRERWIDPREVEVLPLSFGIMIVTMAINGAISYGEWRIGRRVGSQILLSDSAHTRSDVLVSITVIISLIAVKAGLPWVDLAVALLIALFICHTGWKIISQGIMAVSDVAAIPPEEIREICLGFPRVQEVEQIRTRSHSDRIFLDLILVVDPDQTVQSSHSLVDRIEAAIIQKWPGIRDILIHVEPAGLERRSPGRPRATDSERFPQVPPPGKGS